MDHFSTLNHHKPNLHQLEKDLHQLERSNNDLTKVLSLGVRNTKTQELPIFSNLNIELVEFVDTEISYLGV